MKASLVLILCVIVGFGQKEIALKLTDENPFNLRETFKIIDEEDGFYEEVISTASPNGNIYIYDKGNKMCHIYNKDGERIKSFGKSGNGPGEFSDAIIDIAASDSRILFKNLMSRSVILFDNEGNYLKDLKGNLLIGGQIVPKKDQIEFHFPENKFSQTLRITYDNDGNELSKTENKGFVEGALEDAQRNVSSESIKESLKSPISFTPYNGGFVQHYQSEYILDFMDTNHKMVKRFTYPYERVKIENLMTLVPRFQRKFIKAAPKKNQAMAFKVFEKLKNEMGGYHVDIIAPIGAHNGYLFVQTRAKTENVLRMHIISKEDNIAQNVEIECDEITSAVVSNGYLFVNQVNEEDGPYSSVYKL